jgi:hypothetical protein
MNITINIIEVASELADKDLITAFGGEGGKNSFPNGIVRGIVEEGHEIIEYTDEAQDFFNYRYDYWLEYWFEFLLDQNVGDDE